MIFKKTLWVIFICMPLLHTRSIHRLEYKKKPSIATQWLEGGKTYYLKSWYLEEDPVFNKFDRNHFYSHQLPQNMIMFRNKKQGVQGSILSTLIEELIQEIYEDKKSYTHFSILKDSDFNPKHHAGILVVKFNDYPFVVKLFLETPHTFVKPYSKGWQPACIFILGRGINRYLAGFDRIKNLEATRKRITKNSYWKHKADTPRKWFVAPKNLRWFKVTGTHIGGEKTISIDLPSVYAVVADEIKGRPLNILIKKDRKLGIRFAKFLNNQVDPHIDNFVEEEGTKKIIPIDYEHFPSLLGVEEQFTFERYSEWYIKLAGKFIHDAMFQTKQERIDAQMQKKPASKLTRASLFQTK